MIVCQCKGTAELTVRKAIRAGATTIGEIGAACSAGAECGGCHQTLEQLLHSERGESLSEQIHSWPVGSAWSS